MANRMITARKPKPRTSMRRVCCCLSALEARVTRPFSRKTFRGQVAQEIGPVLAEDRPAGERIDGTPRASASSASRAAPSVMELVSRCREEQRLGATTRPATKIISRYRRRRGAILVSERQGVEGIDLIDAAGLRVFGMHRIEQKVLAA